MKEVQNKWNTLKLNDDIWAKLIYFEQNRRLAKAYVSAPMLTVDGSTSGLDGFRIGLSGIDNAYRSLQSIGCLRSIGQGIKLKIDNQGNILIRKVGQNQIPSQCSVWVKDWPLKGSPEEKGANSSEKGDFDENCSVHQLKQSDGSYKLFDMRKFRLQLEKRKLNNDNTMDWRQCVSIISFVCADDEKRTEKLLEDPCWLMIINIIAIDMLKSSICDNNKAPIEPEVSNSITRTNNISGPSDYSMHDKRALKGPLRTSSSASVLFPSISNSSSNWTSGNESVGNFVAPYDRAKKLRTTNSRYRLTSKKNKTSRRYQSTQQLSSGNNTIYTTFNNKFTPRQYADYSSASDYNSASRSTSSSQNYLRIPQSFIQLDPLQERTQLFTKTGESLGMPFGRKSILSLLEQSNKSLSLSAFDLSRRRVDLRSMQSAIKMNYDNPAEPVDQLNDDRFQAANQNMLNDQRPFPIGNRRALTSLSNHSKSLLQNSDLERESSHCCELANHGQTVNNLCRAKQEFTEPDAKERQQKVSRSSIASSSSSSGCVDNDYFMSHSSSSMTSSTASNERELFSQPASSNGIVCSGNTSDEYDDNRKPTKKSPVIDDDAVSPPAKPNLANQISSKDGLNNDDNHGTGRRVEACKSHRRGFKIKTVEPADCCCCQHVGSHYSNARLSDCDCPTVDIDYECCCDCYFEPIGVKAADNICRCESDATHPRLANIPSTKKKSTGKDLRKEGESDGSSTRTSSLANLGDHDSEEVFRMSAPEDRSGEAIKELKQSGSWLEKRKYSKIFPKFIFSSSSSNSRQMDTESKIKSTQRKSSTIESNDKFRLTKSSHDLS